MIIIIIIIISLEDYCPDTHVRTYRERKTHVIDRLFYAPLDWSIMKSYRDI